MLGPLPSRSPLEFFFFQAEDGIRATSVTGVQTCALPILLALTLCPSVLVLPARPSLLRLQECALLDFGLRARNHRFPVVAMLLCFPKLASLRLEIGRASCRERV